MAQDPAGRGEWREEPTDFDPRDPPVPRALGAQEQHRDGAQRGQNDPERIPPLAVFPNVPEINRINTQLLQRGICCNRGEPEMNPCELTAAINTLANLLAFSMTADELTLLGSVLVQLGDTLATIATQRSICCDRG